VYGAPSLSETNKMQLDAMFDVMSLDEQYYLVSASADLLSITWASFRVYLDVAFTAP
jgi:hypothetical protein